MNYFCMAISKRGLGSLIIFSFFLLSGEKVEFMAPCGAKKFIFNPPSLKKSYVTRKKHLLWRTQFFFY